MAGTADGLDQEGGGGVANKSAFFEIQQHGLAGIPHHAQAYPSHTTYSSQHEAVFATGANHPRSLGAYTFPMNNAPLNSSLHGTYSHSSHAYMSTYPANCPPCASPPRDAASSLVALQSRMMGSAPYNSRLIKDEPQWDLGYYEMGVGDKSQLEETLRGEEDAEAADHLLQSPTAAVEQAVPEDSVLGPTRKSRARRIPRSHPNTG